MQLFADDQKELKRYDLHELIDELINIVTLCQIIEKATEPAEIRRYAGMLSDIANKTIKLGKDLQISQMLE